MKVLGSIEQPIGSDGKVVGSAKIDSDFLTVSIEAKYPTDKIIGPVTTAINNLLDKLEKVIPGDWDKPYIETLKAEAKAEILKQLGE